MVDEIDLVVRSGELVTLVGPNGAGKSSLLGALSGGSRGRLHGTVHLDGRPVDDWSALQAARRRAVLTQQVSVAFSFTGGDVVRMGRTPWRGTVEALDDESAVADALVGTDTEHLVDRPITACSGGERARIALARVLAQGTQVLLLDEPTAALDLHHVEVALGAVRARVDRGDAAVVVLHDLSAAAAHADRVALLDGGRLVACGAPHEVLTAPLLSGAYGHAIEVVDHPNGTSPPLVVPVRHTQPFPTPPEVHP